jgi:ribosomal protein S18 acetylase RimI-like enzyme
MQIRAMTLADYDAVIALMQATPGITVRDADSREATEAYLARNPGCSFVADINDQVCGCIMAGHDGRRGYLQHLIVLAAHRRQGIATALVNASLTRLAQDGIHKFHVDVIVENDTAARYWERLGWHRRDDIHRYSFISPGNENA